MPDEITVLEQHSVQQDDIQEPQDYSGSFGFLNWVVRAGETISPWWSQARDIGLRKFYMLA
jgi:hypothetical protein